MLMASQAQQAKPLVAGLTCHSPLFTTFSRRLLGITRTNLPMFREETPRSMQREVRSAAVINFT